jgi:hypothetical protein
MTSAGVIPHAMQDFTNAKTAAKSVRVAAASTYLIQSGNTKGNCGQTKVGMIPVRNCHATKSLRKKDPIDLGK